MFRVVAAAVKPGKDASFFRIMDDLLFLPNSPALMNDGTSRVQLPACFVLPAADSIPGIFTALTQMAVIP
jgi:ribonucleoside-diphosphate reductase alpha chain